VISVTQTAGETLYVPGGWWHATYNEENAGLVLGVGGVGACSAHHFHAVEGDVDGVKAAVEELLKASTGQRHSSSEELPLKSSRRDQAGAVVATRGSAEQAEAERVMSMTTAGKDIQSAYLSEQDSAEEEELRADPEDFAAVLNDASEAGTTVLHRVVHTTTPAAAGGGIP